MGTDGKACPSAYSLERQNGPVYFNSSRCRACAAAEEGLGKYVRARMADNGIFECSVNTEKEDRYTEIFSSGKRTYIETKINACASTGRTVIR